MFCDKCGSRLSDGTRYCPVCGKSTVANPMPVNDPEAKSIAVLKRKETRGKAMVFTTVKVLALILLLISIFMPQISVYEGRPTIVECFDTVLHDLGDISYPPIGIKLSAFFFSILLGVAALIESKPAAIIFSGLGLFFQASIMYSYLGSYIDSMASLFGIGEVSIFAYASVALFLWAFIASCCIVSNEFSKDEIKEIARKARKEKNI